MISAVERVLRRIGQSADSVSARVVDTTQLPPSPDGRTYRYEAALRLDESVTSPPDESGVRELADGIRSELEEIDDPEWEGVDELWIQVYGPDRELDGGSCGTAHWLAVEGYERVETREYMF